MTNNGCSDVVIFRCTLKNKAPLWHHSVNVLKQTLSNQVLVKISKFHCLGLIWPSPLSGVDYSFTGLLWFELIQQRGGCDFAVTFRATICFNFGFGTIWDSPFVSVTHFQIPVVHFHAIQAIGWLHMLWMSQKQYFETDPLWCQRLYSCHPLPQCGPLETQDSSLTDSSCNLMAVKILVVLFLNYVEWTLREKFSLCP